MKLIYLKSALKCNSFDEAIDIKIQFFRVLVTIEPGRSLLQFVTTNCLKVFLEPLICVIISVRFKFQWYSLLSIEIIFPCLFFHCFFYIVILENPAPFSLNF